MSGKAGLAILAAHVRSKKPSFWLVVGPFFYSAVSFAFAYGVAFGISPDLHKLMTISDFYRISLSFASLVVAALLSIFVIFAMNVAFALGDIDERYKSGNAVLKKWLSRFLIFAPYILFICVMAVSLYWQREGIEFFGTDNPLGIINATGGVGMALAPLMMIWPIMLSRAEVRFRLAVIAATIVALMFFAGNTYGLMKRHGLESGAVAVIESSRSAEVLLVLDEYVVMLSDGRIIARPSVEEIRFQTSES